MVHYGEEDSYLAGWDNFVNAFNQTVEDAYQIEKKIINKVLRTGGKIVDAAGTSATGLGKGVASTASAIPWLLIILGGGVAGYLYYMGKSGKQLSNKF